MNIHAPAESFDEAALADLCEEEGLDIVTARALLRVGQKFRHRPFRAATPTFRDHDSDELGACRRSAVFPAFSITGGACALDCAHCRARLLEPMIPAGDPDAFERKARAMIEGQGMRGFLLSGGSNKRNEVPFDRYLPVLRRLKDAHPEVEILAHTGLVSRERAEALARSGVDVAMLDIIGARETINQVYNLDRPVADFEASLENLVATGMKVVPHIVVGLHFGAILGEHAALDIIARHRTRAAIVVVVMPAFADASRFKPVDVHAAGAFFGAARARLGDRDVLLGCARPHGRARRRLDHYATLAGFDGVAWPSDGIMALVRRLGRTSDHLHACCGASRKGAA